MFFLFINNFKDLVLLRVYLKIKYCTKNRIYLCYDVKTKVLLKTFLKAGVCQVHRAPLGEPVAGHGGAVAILGEQRLYRALTAYVVVEDLSHDLLDVLKNVSPVHEVLVESGGIRDVEIIAAGAVIFGVHTVEGVGDLGVYIGADRLLGPCGVDLAGGDVHDVIHEGERYVLGRLVGLAQMNRDGLGNDR